MTPEHFRSTLSALGITQARLGRLLCLDKNTANRWATGSAPIPRAVALLLRLVEDGHVSIVALEGFGK
jgi:transcriptional regulator with XRE-family HTH domain